MPTVTTAIANFLAARRAAHNAPELIDAWSSSLETQVNVSAAGGQPVAGRRNTWTDGLATWHHLRIPRHADTEPEWADHAQQWPLDPYVEAIGSTGWNWRTRQSEWVGFDFDALVGHAAGVGVSPAQLEQIKAAATAWPFFEVRRSTGGRGLHLYVRLADGCATANHTEHAALARAILAQAASECGFDFTAQIDACGGNMWLWHRKMSQENRGLELLRATEKKLPVPEWRDHVEVVTRKRTKVRVSGIPQETADEFDVLTSAWSRVPLDAEHKRHIAALSESGFTTVWVPDYHLLQTHTVALQQLHATEKLRGVFETISTGGDPGTANCFAFPLKDGGWRVQRFGRNVNEAPTWTRDQWTWCYFNRPVDFLTAVKSQGAVENAEKREWTLPAAKARAALDLLNCPDIIPDKLNKRSVKFRFRDGRLLLKMERRPGEKTPEGWADTGKQFLRTLDVELPGPSDELDLDKIFRATVTLGDEAGGWATHSGGGWVRNPASNVKMILQSRGNSREEAEHLMGRAADRPWRLVHLPFQGEFPGGRLWNRDAARLSVTPSGRHDEPHPHWDLILDHAGSSLNSALKTLNWANEAGISSGGDYLRAWFASMLREPFEPLPYLFFFGPENSGKSIVWEAANLLMTRGVVKADRALTSQNDFNGELAGAILCVVEEKNIAHTPGALNKIKDFVTARTLSIRRMRQDSYDLPNTTHWMQCSNDADACPIFPGDTRITSIYVPPLAAEISKTLLLEKLKAEAAAFLRTLLDLQLPAASGRLRVPIVETAEKVAAQQSRRCQVEQFIADHCAFDKSYAVSKQAVYASYAEFALGDDELLSNNRFGCRFIQLCGSRIESVNVKVTAADGTRLNGYRGVRLSQ